jgi:hypothetical protein
MCASSSATGWRGRSAASTCAGCIRPAAAGRARASCSPTMPAPSRECGRAGRPCDQRAMLEGDHATASQCRKRPCDLGGTAALAARRAGRYRPERMRPGDHDRGIVPHHAAPSDHVALPEARCARSSPRYATGRQGTPDPSVRIVCPGQSATLLTLAVNGRAGRGPPRHPGLAARRPTGVLCVRADRLRRGVRQPARRPGPGSPADQDRTVWTQRELTGVAMTGSIMWTDGNALTGPSMTS